MPTIRNKVAQGSEHVEVRRLHTLALRALLFDEIKTAVHVIAVADSPYALDVTLLVDVVVLCNAVGGAVTINLPVSATAIAGRHFWFKKTDASANAVTLVPAGSNTIDGAAASYKLGKGMAFVPRPSAHVMADGVGGWHLLGNHKL